MEQKQQEIQYGQNKDFDTEAGLEEKVRNLLANINADLASEDECNVRQYVAEAKTIVSSVQFFVSKYQLPEERVKKYDEWLKALREDWDLKSLGEFIDDIKVPMAVDLGVALGFRAQRQPSVPWEERFLRGSRPASKRTSPN